VGNTIESTIAYQPAREPVFTQTTQIGIVVRDLDATLRRYADDFGIGPWTIFEVTPGECAGPPARRPTARGPHALGRRHDRQRDVGSESRRTAGILRRAVRRRCPCSSVERSLAFSMVGRRFVIRSQVRLLPQIPRFVFAAPTHEDRSHG